MKVSKCKLEGILLIEPSIYIDERGFFLENFKREKYKGVGITEEFVQDNHSRSIKNVLRGLHFTKKKPQSQLVTIIRGRVFDVVVDIRKNSPTFGQWFGTEMSSEGIRQIYMRHGFAHGFCVLSDFADLHYKVSEYYDPNDDGGLIWNDDQINIDWPINDPIVSKRDSIHTTFSKLLVSI
jgi:dTDP-4-dehydrorhamnose 3,5-epimerase